MCVDGEDDADDLTVPAGDLEGIRAPAQVRAHHHDLAVMEASVPSSGVPGEQQAVALHDPEDALVVGGWLGFRGQFSVHKRGDAPVAVGWPLVDQAADQG